MIVTDLVVNSYPCIAFMVIVIMLQPFTIVLIHRDSLCYIGNSDCLICMWPIQQIPSQMKWKILLFLNIWANYVLY